jgi:hypothetical protein
MAGGCGLDASDSGQGTVAGCCEHGNEPSVSTKQWEFFDQLNHYSFSRMTLFHGVNLSFSYLIFCCVVCLCYYISHSIVAQKQRVPIVG